MRKLFERQPLLVKYILASSLLYAFVIVAGILFNAWLVPRQKDLFFLRENQQACHLIRRIAERGSFSAAQAFAEFQKLSPDFFADTTAVLEAPAGMPSEPCQLLIDPRDTDMALYRLDAGHVLRTAYRNPQKQFLSPKDFTRDPASDRIYRRHPLVLGMTPENLSSLVLIVFLFAGFLISSGLMFRLISRSIETAGGVLDELKRGNLKVRWKPHRGLGIKFNEMADEIERLVERVSRAESARARILQELAHDLRTPVASLQGLLESMRDKRHLMKEERFDDFFDSALHEAFYFGRLVEDLLFISGVEDPHYKPEYRAVDLALLLREELSPLNNQEDLKITLEAPEHVPVRGDAQLLQRLLRNGIDNALSFARHEIGVRVTSQENLWRIEIMDDGPGISVEEALNFGIKRRTRKEFSREDERISLGLGSVIMRRIAFAHRGEVSIAPRSAPARGSCLCLLLPQAADRSLDSELS